MCSFFSFVGDGFGNYRAIEWETRKKWIAEDSDKKADSHGEILTLANVPPKMQHRWDKYEYNPLTGNFKVDQGIDGHDHDAARAWVEHLDFKRIVEPLIIKPIVHPFKLPKREATSEDIALLKEWDSVRDSVGTSVGTSVWASVGDSVGTSVRNSAWDSVRASVRNSVRNSVWDSVRASVWDSVRNSVRNSMEASVWDSVWDSVRAYISSFFDIPYKYDFTPCVKLWERGLVPSFDGETWRLHSGGRAEIVYESGKEGENDAT